MVQFPSNHDLPQVDAELTYIQPPPSGEKLYLHIDPEHIPSGEPRDNSTSQVYHFPIRDIRGSEERFSLSTSGFEVIQTPETVAKLGDGSRSREEWNDSDWVKNVYEKEVERLLIEHTGATRVHIFDHTIRRQDNTGNVKDTPQTRQPVIRVHIDQTPASAVARVERHLGEDAKDLLKKRFCLINVWRPLRGPVLDAPLTLADYRSVDPTKDLLPLELRRGPQHPPGETFAVLHNDRHQWYYLSKMQPDEALFIKCHDSDDRPGNARFTPHTAFYDQHYKGKVDPRQSIEVRALAFF